MRFQKAPVNDRYYDKNIVEARVIYTGPQTKELIEFVERSKPRCRKCGFRMYLTPEDVILPDEEMGSAGVIGDARAVHVKKPSWDNHGAITWKCENCHKLTFQMYPEYFFRTLVVPVCVLSLLALAFVIIAAIITAIA